jgi:hypothetical protein
MRCYFLRGGHIVAAEELTSVLDKEAISEARVLFSKHENPVETFEVWDGTRANSHASVHPPPTAGGSNDVELGVDGGRLRRSRSHACNW